jgi:O-methyltransferase domain/Dimerisation domain
MLQLVTGFLVSQAIRAAAELKIADQLADGPKSAAELAALTGGMAEPIDRVLRALSSVGIFEEQDHKYRLTPLAEHLRTDSAESVWPAAMFMGSEVYRVAHELPVSVRTGTGNFDRVLGMRVFEYLSANKDRGAIFDRMMASFHGPETAAIVDAYDFSAMPRVVDIGGGNGDVLQAVLRANRDVHGVLFDLPGVVDRARAAMPDDTVADRLSFEAGDFFAEVSSGGDAYILRHIIHDWGDDESVDILRRCRDAMHPGAKILVIEEVIPDGNVPSPAKWLDVAFLAAWTGKERTRAQYDELYRRSGLELTRVVPTATPVSIVEGIPRRES